MRSLHYSNLHSTGKKGEAGTSSRGTGEGRGRGRGRGKGRGGRGRGRGRGASQAAANTSRTIMDCKLQNGSEHGLVKC